MIIFTAKCVYLPSKNNIVKRIGVRNRQNKSMTRKLFALCALTFNIK